MATLYSINVNGLNSPQKRALSFRHLKNQNADIVCVQETHIKRKGIRLMEQPRLGKIYVSASYKEKKRGVAIYVKERLDSKLISCDEEGRWIGVEINLNGRKC